MPLKVVVMGKRKHGRRPHRPFNAPTLPEVLDLFLTGHERSQGRGLLNGPRNPSAKRTAGHTAGAKETFVDELKETAMEESGSKAFNK